MFDRTRMFMMTLAVAVGWSITLPASAQLSGDSLKTLLGNASDAALNRLSRPGAFSTDDAIRIGMPGQVGKLGDMLQLSDRVGVTNDLSGQLNRAAEAAAAEAKPVFRAAIDRITVRDAIGIGTRGNTAATDFLKRTSGNDIVDKIGPIVKTALARAGALKQTAALASLGMNADRLTTYVSQKTADGIFTYMGREEARMRSDPATAGKTLLKGLKF